MENEKIKQILIDSIDSFKNIDGYEMIGIFGSITKEKEEFGDLDLVSIGENRIHKKFKNHLIKQYSNNGFNIRFFESIVNKPNLDNNILLIHDLHYGSKEEFLKKEWKIIINVMRENVKVLYGNDIIRELPKQKISKKDICLPFLKWVDNINNNKDYILFENYILLYLKKDFYDNGLKKEGDNIKSNINSNKDWKIKLDKIKEILRSN